MKVGRREVLYQASYGQEMVQRHGQDYDWRSQPIDPQVAYASAGGQAHGRLGIFDSTIDSRELRRRGRQSASSSSQASGSRSSAQDIEIAVLRQQADYHQAVLRQQMEYQRQQAEYQKKDEYYSNLLAQNQALLSQLAQQAGVPMPTYGMPPPDLAPPLLMLSPPPPPQFPVGFETPPASVAAPGDGSGQDDASASWVNNFFNTQSPAGGSGHNSNQAGDGYV